MLIPIAIAINVVLGQTVGTALKLPVYLDSIGTILVGVLAGPIAGAATGLLSNLAWTFLLAGTPFGSPYAWPFAIVAVEIGLLAGLFGYAGVFRSRPGNAAVAEALADVGLAHRADANPYDLGASRRRLLALASVLAMRTPIVVLDEPTMGLDRGEVARVEAVVARLTAAGRTVVAISHDARFVAGSFERVVRLDAGRVVVD